MSKDKVVTKRVPVREETHRRVKLLAVATGRTMEDVVEELLTRSLREAEQRAA